MGWKAAGATRTRTYATTSATLRCPHCGEISRLGIELTREDEQPAEAKP